MRVDVLTLFPEMITSYCDQSILKIAQDKKLLEVNAHNPRDFSTDKHKCVDDVPYGGGAGMLLMPQPIYDCFESVSEQTQLNNHKHEVIITCPTGRPFNQELAQELATKDNLVFICGRYEGVDERIRQLATMEVSLGDYVLTGGELAALTIIDASTRLIEGVLGDDESSEIESFKQIDYMEKFQELGVTKRELNDFLENTGLKSKEDLNELSKLGLLEYPQYTRPAEFKSMEVPEILRSGDHKKIFLWRLEEAIKLSRKKRPDLYA